MVCTKCGCLLEDGAKFCAECGTPANDLGNNVGGYVQQPQNNMISQPIIQKNMTKSVKLIFAIMTLIILILCGMVYNLSKENDEYFDRITECEKEIYEYRKQIGEYADQIGEYENKNALDKTFDAVDSWIDMFN